MPPFEIIRAKTIQQVLKTGHSPLLVRCEDNKMYYVKSRRSNSFVDPYIVAEFLCHEFLKLWDLNTPQVKGVLVDQELIDANGLKSHPRWRHCNDSVCFASQKVDTVYELSYILDPGSFGGMQKLRNPYDYLRIGLFDLWVVNDDRNPRNFNLILVNADGKLDFYAIDHAYTLNTLPLEDLNNQVFASSNDSILDCDFPRKLINSKVTPDLPDLKPYFKQSVKECRDNHESIISSIEESLQVTIPGKPQLEQFLYDKGRLDTVFQDYYSYLMQ